MRCLALGLTALLWATDGLASDKLAYGPAPAWVQPSEPSTKVDAASDAAIKVLLIDQEFNFGSLGDEAYFENVVRIQTSQGLAAMSTLSVPWKPETDLLTVHKLHVIRGDEVIDIIATGQTFTILRRENNLEYSALDGVLTAAIQPSGLRVGDTIDFAFSIKRTDPVFAGTSEQLVGNWPELPIARVRVRAHWPDAASIRWKSSKAIVGAKEKHNGGVSEFMLALDDIEPLPQPIGAPLRFRVAREVEFSGFKSWSEIAKRIAPLYARSAALTSQSQLNAEIARIRAENAEPILRAGAALALVQDQVRYVFLGMNDGGFVPTGADVTWTRRFGDCKAKTALLLALLHGLDIEAEPVAVNTILGDGLDSRLPMLGVFDHVLVRAVIAGKPYWLDGTRTGDRRLDALAVPNFHWGLPLVLQGSELIRIPTTPLTAPTVATTIRIDATSGLHVPAPFHVDGVLTGDAATAFKLSIANLSATDRERGLRTYWSKAYDFVDVQSVSATFDEATNEEHVSMDGSANMDWKSDWYHTDGLSVGYDADFTRPPGANNDAPFAVPFPLYSRARETIILPKGQANFTLDGADYDLVVAGIEYKRHSKIEKGVFVGEATTRSIKTEFPAAEAPEAQRVLRKMRKDSLYIQAPKDYLLTDQELVAEVKKPLEQAYAYIDRGNMLLNRGKYDLAIADFDKALALDSKADMAFADRGMAYLWKREDDHARKDIDAAFAINARNPVVFNGRGLLALNKGNASDAIANFTTSLDIEPRGPFALEYRARAYRQAGQGDRALVDAAAAIGLRANAIDMYVLRAAVFNSQGELDKAIAELVALIAANRNNPFAYTSAGAMYSSFKMQKESLQAFDRAVEIDPTEFNYLSRANYRPRTDIAGKRADVAAALKLNDHSIRALLMKAKIQVDAREYAEAIATYGAALAIGGDESDILVVRGIAYAKNNQPELADKDYAAARTKTASAGSLNNICWSIATSNVSLSAALEICDEAVAKAPTSAAYIDSRAFVLLRLGRYEEAIVAYDNALKLAPKQSASLYGRGIAKRFRGDASASKADIDAALAVSPAVADNFAEYGIGP